MAQQTIIRAVRGVRGDEIDALTDLWYQGWQEAHAAILPAELVRLRTRESFGQRLQLAQPRIRVAGPPGAPLGFCVTDRDELNQLFVAPGGRGKGVAGALEADAVSIMARRGTKTAWLSCAIGNDRAARFYEKAGWRRMGTVVSQLQTQEGMFPLEVWRYEKTLAPV